MLKFGIFPQNGGPEHENHLGNLPLLILQSALFEHSTLGQTHSPCQILLVRVMPLMPDQFMAGRITCYLWSCLIFTADTKGTI